MLTWVAEQTGTFCNPCSGLTGTSIQCGVFSTAAEQQKGHFSQWGRKKKTHLLPVDFFFPQEIFLKALLAHHGLREEHCKFLLGSFLEEGVKGWLRAKHCEA